MKDQVLIDREKLEDLERRASYHYQVSVGRSTQFYSKEHLDEATSTLIKLHNHDVYELENKLIEWIRRFNEQEDYRRVIMHRSLWNRIINKRPGFFD
jgi:hypothetical protein